ncbi:hypothetical protein ANO14919_060390 [Xylariales sp. No.14919]|nr:hypothetical protein ANO14919_060390 [Xylariales sp. No.14919]
MERYLFESLPVYPRELMSPVEFNSFLDVKLSVLLATPILGKTWPQVRN